MEYIIKEDTQDMLPRERLEKYGEKVLSNAELLSLILRVGTPKENVFHLSQRILDRYESLYELRQESLESLKEISGVGSVKASQIRAMIELGKRIQLSRQEVGKRITSSYELALDLMEELHSLTQENLIVIFLNTQNFVIRRQTLFIGTLNQSIAHPREIYREAVRCSAASIILVHNHPSGDATPSKNDENITKKIEESGRMIGIPLLDHLIIGDNQYFSFREEKKLH
ncbi:DNA repair protein RadC [Pilibacter termitis]|uniref:DNA repair protein RadC n=1 Tax=Pilibacter termitis TaxID=263852 RepID=A0A1T4L2D4_9ENTE|nr:DNA repair protein RadC [Pilibacter termitis]SJZ48902.1 DNA repair protein RadC [Pilibacter termitis]